MAAHETNPTPPVQLFRDWDLTAQGRFVNKLTKKEYSRAEWEMEVAYLFTDNPDALEFARGLSSQAAELETKAKRPSPLLLARRKTA